LISPVSSANVRDLEESFGTDLTDTIINSEVLGLREMKEAWV